MSSASTVEEYVCFTYSTFTPFDCCPFTNCPTVSPYSYIWDMIRVQFKTDRTEGHTFRCSRVHARVHMRIGYMTTVQHFVLGGSICIFSLWNSWTTNYETQSMMRFTHVRTYVRTYVHSHVTHSLLPDSHLVQSMYYSLSVCLILTWKKARCVVCPLCVCIHVCAAHSLILCEHSLTTFHYLFGHVY